MPVDEPVRRDISGNLISTLNTVEHESRSHFLSPEGNRVFIIVNLILFSSHSKPTIDVAKLLTGWKVEWVVKRWRKESLQKFQLVGELSEDNRTYRNNLLPFGSRDGSVYYKHATGWTIAKLRLDSWKKQTFSLIHRFYQPWDLYICAHTHTWYQVMFPEGKADKAWN